MKLMDLTQTDIDAMTDEELQARIMGDKTFAAATELSHALRSRDADLDDTMARRERRVVMSERMRHTDDGPVLMRDFIGIKESGDLFTTDVGHEAVVDTDLHEMTALASRATRELPGFWRVVETRTLAQPSWARLQTSPASLAL